MPTVLDELAGCVSGSDTVGQTYERKELIAAINNFLSTLPAEKRNIFVCRYWYTDSIDEIAARYDMTYGAVSMLLNRLRTKLRNYLVERGYEL